MFKMKKVIFLLEYAYSYAEQFKGKDEWTILKQLQSVFQDEQAKFILTQILNINRYAEKFPNLVACRGILPTEIVQQATSELVASHKASFFHGDSFLDLTFGLGIDTFAFAKNFHQVFATERNPSLYYAGLQNLHQLNITNVQLICTDAVHFLQANNLVFDLVYLDPMRTFAEKKVFHPTHSSPNPMVLLPYIQPFAKKLLIKLSPMVEVKELTKWFPDIELIWAISVRNECKELLCLLNLEHAIYRPKKRTSFFWQNTFHAFEWNNSSQESSLLLSYSYQDLLENYSYLLLPDVTFYKQHLLVELQKVTDAFLTHIHRGILFLKQIPEKIYGKLLKIIHIFPFQKVAFKKYLSENEIHKATLQTYHFPETAANLRKQWKLQDDPNQYFIFLQAPATGRIVIHAKAL